MWVSQKKYHAEGENQVVNTLSTPQIKKSDTTTKNKLLRDGHLTAEHES